MHLALRLGLGRRRRNVSNGGGEEPAPAGDVLLLTSSDELDPASKLLLSGTAQTGTDALALSEA